MSLKKTWFSYILWFVFAGITALITYVMLVEVLQGYYAMLCSNVPRYAFGLFCVTKIAIVVVAVLLVVLLRLICSKIKMPSIPRGLGITGHILFYVGIISGFCVFRYQVFNYAYYLQSYLSAPSEQALYLYELSKVGSTVANSAMSFLELVYISVIRTIFMFFGNKLECLFLTQLVLQAVTLVLLMVIGRTMQKGICGWLPALLYAIVPTYFYTASDVGITNFWVFVVVFVLFIICLLEKAWKKKNITYLVMVFMQLLFGGFVFYNKMGVLLYNKAPFVSRGKMPGLQEVLYIETLVVVAYLLVYCVTFFMDKQDHRSLFILPVLVYSILFVWLSVYEYEAFYCMMLLALMNLYFMISQSMRTIFRGKPEVVTGKNKTLENAETETPVKQENEQMEPTKFEWAEMKEVMHSTEGIEVRKEEPVKVELPITEVSAEEKKIVEKSEVIADVDRKAPIENVLPMPKKHKPKVLDYAFEPTEDLMHYDVEIENDDYDY